MNKFTTGRLLEPKTQSFNDKVYAESLVVFKHFKRRGEAWIGINGKGGPWVYTSSGNEFDFENWNAGQPNVDGHDCVYWGWENTNGEWSDHDCNENKFFICEFV